MRGRIGIKGKEEKSMLCLRNTRGQELVDIWKKVLVGQAIINTSPIAVRKNGKFVGLQETM